MRDLISRFLLRDCRFLVLQFPALLLHFAVLFEELVEQHRVEVSSLLNTVEESDYFVTNEFRTAGCDRHKPVEKGMSIAGIYVFLII